MNPALLARTAATAVILAAVAFGLPACSAPATTSSAATTINPATHGGWADALRLENRAIEVIVVPAVGRVMSFRFRDGQNIFWEDASLHGQQGDASGQQWINFGGDKSWPSPEAEWKNYTGHKQWMPPPAFDALPNAARVEDGAVVLTSPVDRFYGVRVIRRIALAGDTPTMTIETTYERVSGAPAKIGIWVITQLVEPVAVYVPVPNRSMFPGGHFVFRDTPWPQLGTTGPMLKLTRDPKGPHKLGSDADRMLWVGETAMCLIASPRVSGGEYPDRGASAEVYTNQDPKKYVELETLGPLALMRPGDRISRINTYTLLRRTAADPDADARKALGLDVTPVR